MLSENIYDIILMLEKVGIIRVKEAEKVKNKLHIT
tara:strand:+ start:9453 stop:9557 length:105 start_codon:yes stop_codon:yes gene_type:complete